MATTHQLVKPIQEGVSNKLALKGRQAFIHRVRGYEHTCKQCIVNVQQYKTQASESGSDPTASEQLETRGLILERSQEEFKRNLRGISSELDLGQHLAFMKVFSSGICSELQKTFRTRNSSRNSARVFSNAIP